MSQEESFDSFYESTRHATLVSTFAMTGDRPAAEAAVRESYARAWQHWRRVSALSDPPAWVRQRAWRLAERLKPTAAVRGSLPASLAELSREERRELALEVTVEHVPDRLAPLAALVAGASYPSASVVRRAGRKRRRTRLLLGAAAVVAVALVVAGSALLPDGDLGAASGPSTPAGQPTSTPSPRLPVSGDLLDGRQVRGLGGPGSRAWTVARTDANTSGDGINSVCQQRRFADPRGDAAIVRAFRAAGTPRRTAVQTVEVSRSATQARRTYLTTLGWYAGCRVARLQVLDAYRVDRVGDQAQILTLMLAERPSRSMTVAVARTGSVVTSTVGTTVGAGPTPVAQVVRTLQVAVQNLCVRKVAGRCVTRPAYHAVPPPPAGPGEERGVLAVADLPPVGRVEEPWVGTLTSRAGASSDPSVARCGGADFRRAGAVSSRTRTYLVPQSTLPARFGLTETYGTFATVGSAARFLATMRADLAGCEKRDVTTDVGPERRSTRARLDASQWLLTTTVSSSEKVPFRVGFVRAGRSVARLTFTPTPGADLAENVFGSLLTRAGDRLRELPRAGRP